MNTLTLTIRAANITDAVLRDIGADAILAVTAAGGVVKTATVDVQSAENGITLAAARKAQLQALPQQNPEA